MPLPRARRALKSPVVRRRDRARVAVTRSALAALAALTLALSGCASTTTVGPPKATPADITGIATALQEQGLTIRDLVSGDAGCADPDMVASAIGFHASGRDQPTPVAVHLYIFRNDASYQKLRSAVDTCARSWVADPGGYEAIDASPFVLAGQGPWPAEFKAALRAGLVAAAGEGD